MTVANLREFVIAAYPSRSWKSKVDKMSDAQVYAVYVRINNPSSKKWSNKK